MTADDAEPTFGTSGVRGRVGEAVTADLALAVGRAVASDGCDRVVVGRDVRDSGGMLRDAVVAGLRECGADVVDLGVVSTPTLARSVGWEGAAAGVAVTASHNPPRDNGLKLWSADGSAFARERQRRIGRRVRDASFDLSPWDEVGSVTERGDAPRRHARALRSAVDGIDPLDVVVDVGNGTGRLTADVLDRLGCDVVTLNGQPDGRFPGRPSEPTAAACTALRRHVERTDADLGVAHDGDADRTMAVTERGEFVDGDVLLALFARAVAGRGDEVAAPVNASLAVDEALDAVGASVVRTRVGDGFVAAETAREGVVFGGEPSGAWIWPDATRCPDGPLAACRLVELLGGGRSLGELVDGVETYPLRRESVAVDDGRKAAVLDRVRERSTARYDEVDTTDGVRVERDDGWFLVRASGTQPLVRITAETRDADALDRVVGEARSLVETAVERA
ncbi:MAG: phosphoglucosamine mutase [Haloferacaceae archaeon]